MAQPTAAQHLHEILDIMINTYQTNEYVYGRLVNHMEHLLPAALENALVLNKQREERKTNLTVNRDEFTLRFLEKNNYFYSVPTELFLKYDGLHFGVYCEDDIQHQILSTISSEKYLREWKHKINKNIIKRIKERSPLNAIPETETIQFVLNGLCPAIFQTRNQAKYFLTIIGECLAHNSLNIYIFPPVLKEIIREIGNQCYTYLGLPNIFTNVKFKYYDHKYVDCRLLSLGHVVKKKISIPILMKQYMLDVLCVAAHYASRYGNSDNFLQQCNEITLVDHALFLNIHTQENIVNDFIAKTLTIGQAAASASETPTIDLKNMIYLWKKYLDDRAIPNIIFYDVLKTLLKTKLKYDESTEHFVGVTSLQLPIVAQFMLFWDENLLDALDTSAELEIDEISSLFKLNTSKHINDEQIMEIIQHFYPDVVIAENKYIRNVKCKLWDKRADVLKALAQFKQSPSPYTAAYEFYCAFNKNKNTLLVSKRYFESITSELCDA